MICSTACTETIYNVIDAVPYTISTTGLYGHYSLFFYVPFKILGESNPFAVGILIAIVACTAQLAVLYVIHVFCPKNWIRMIFSLASIIEINYYFPGCFPIRIFCPIIMCAFLVYLFKKKHKVWMTKWMLAGILLSMISLIWNFEMGVGRLFGFVTYSAIECLQNNSVPWKKMVPILITIVVILPIICILGAIIIVNIYNVICGGNIIFRAFFYPLVKGGNWIIDITRKNPPLGNHLWVNILILLFGSICWALYDTRLFHRKNKYMEDTPVIAGIASIGLAGFSYYMNEAAWGAIVMVHQVAVALCAVIMGRIYQVLIRGKKYVYIEHQVKRVAALTMLAILSVYALETVQIPAIIKEKNEADAYGVEKIISEMEVLQASVPANTYGVGQGINVIYHIIGWDNHANFRDTSSLNSSSSVTYEEVINEILQQDAFLLEKTTWYDRQIMEDILLRTGDFTEKESYIVGQYEYGYFVRD